MNFLTQKIKRSFVILSALAVSNSYLAQNVTVSGALIGNGSYVDLKSAFAAINGGAQTAANITIDISASTTETASAVLNAGTWATLSITPSGGALRTVSGNFASPLVDLNGADNVYINGLNTGGNGLTFSNASTTGHALRFINGATNNSLTNCSALGSSTGAALGVIFFSTSTSVGNSNNTISTCSISAAGTNYPANCLLSAGTSTAVNANNTIQNCHVFNFFSASAASSGINVGTNSSNWTITGNRIFQTLARTYTTGSSHRPIQVNSGSAYIISDNIIGYASGNGTGIYTMAGAVASTFIGIQLSAATGTAPASSIQGNTISAINFTSTSAAGTSTGVLCGISIASGNANVGNVSANLIGAASGTNAITVQCGSGGMLVGINSNSTNSVVIQNNSLGGLFCVGTTAANSIDIVGVNVSGIATYLNVSNNTIGNTTVNNMQGGTNGVSTGLTSLSGINVVPNSTGTIIMANNIIQNFSSYGTGNSFARGIWTAHASSTATFSILSNTISNLTTASGLATVADGKAAALGIGVAGGSLNVISDNSIYNVALTNTGTTAGYAVGISVANGTSPRIFNNKIYNITNAKTSTTTTAPGVAAGILIRSATTSAYVYNNMISLGNGSSENTAFIGINANHGETPNPNTDFIYYNSINIEGTAATGAQPSFGFYRGDFSGTARNIEVDFKNNIITNTRSGGTSEHFAIANNYGAGTSSPIGWGTNASNYNVLNSNASTIGWWTSSQNFAGWKTTADADANSYSGIPVTYVNASNDLHLNMGITPTSIESGGQVIAGITNDYDGQSRPGPAGSSNGGGIAPDIGADEIDAVIYDVLPAGITYTALPGACSVGDRTLTVTITDLVGIPVTGTLVPRIYYKKNGGSFASDAGMLIGGTSTNGTWNFVVSASALGGLVINDVVSYYIIAQDYAGNISSSPATGLVATNVNTVTTDPSTPNFYYVGSLSGSYNVGATGTFTSLTQAAIVYNNSCLTGAVTYILTDGTYSAAENFPIVFRNNIYANATNSLLIKPLTSVSPTITGSSALAIIAFSGADYIKIDGSNNGTSTKDLTVENTSTNTTSSVLFIGNDSPTDAASYITINNSFISGNHATTTFGGLVISSGINPGTAPEISNNFISVSGNSFIKSYYGILALGNATTPDQNWTIVSNTFGSTNAGDKIGYRAVNVQNAEMLSIRANTITGVTSSVVTNPPAGIVIAGATSNGEITHNVISDVKNLNTTTASGASGILLSTTSATANLLISNNMISDIAGYGATGVALGSNGNGMTISSGNGYRIYHNSILLNTNQFNITTTGRQACLHITSGITAGAIDLRNNIFAVTQTVGVRYCLQSSTSNANIFSNIDHNIYSTNGASLGFLSSARATLADMQIGFGGNLNSSTLAPVFASATDLHLIPASNGAIDDLGTAIGQVTLDIDNQVRSASVPDIGADEFTGPGCTSVNAGTMTASSVNLCVNQSTILTAPGGSSGSGITMRWKVSSTQGGPYTDVSTGSGYYTPNLNITGLAAGTLYYVLTTSCSAASLSAISNEATITINPIPSTSISSTHTMACQTNSVILTGSGATSYVWSTGATTSTVQVVPTASTIISFTGTSLSCTNTSSFSLLYSANPVITTASPATFVCLGSQATLTASGANTYTWTDGVNTVNGANFNPTPSVTSTYSVVGTSTNGCISASVSRTVNVSTPTLAVSGNTAVCPGESTTLTASGAVSYTWNTGSNTASTTPTPASNTVYVVSGTSSQGCIGSYSQSIAHGFISVSITGTSSVCEGNSVNLTATGASSYSWSEGSLTSTIVPTPTISTTYTVVGTSGSCTATATKLITFNPIPTVSITGSAIICAGQSTTLTAGGANTYSWSTGSTATVVTVAPATNTTYSVTGTDALGCSNFTNFAVVSNTIPLITIVSSATSVCASTPVTFTASGAGTFTWNTSGPTTTTFNAAPTTTTTYSVSGTNALGCISTKTVAVATKSLPALSVSPSSIAVCYSVSTTFTASGATSYSWNGTAGTSTNQYFPTANVIHTVTGTNAEGCFASANVTIVTNPFPTVTINPASVTICAQSSVQYTASGADTYLWDGFNTGTPVTFNELSSGTHTVEGTSLAGCVSTATVGVTVLALPVVSINPASASVCVFSTNNFTATGAASYLWSNTGTTSVITVNSSVNTTYSVIGTAANGCTASASSPIFVNALPVISISTPSAIVCPSVSINLTAAGNANTYTWTNGPATAVNQITPVATAVYTVSGTNLATGCVGTKTISIATHVAPVISITPGNSTICLNSSITFTASGANTYTWAGTPTGPWLVATPTSASVYSVTGKTINGCSATNTVSVFVNALPVISISPATTNTICLGDVIRYTAAGGSTYLWSPGNSTSPEVNVSPKVTGVYSVKGTDTNGCENTATVSVVVNKCTGIVENGSEDKTINIYPNPSNGKFTMDVYSSAEIMIYDLLGNVIYNNKLEAGTHELNLAEKAKGVYLLKINTNQKQQSMRIVIQ